MPVVDQFCWGLMKSIAKQIEFGDKEMKNGELSNQINLGVISTEGIELGRGNTKKSYHPCNGIWFICKKRRNTNENKKTTIYPQQTKEKKLQSKWEILQKYVKMAPEKNTGVKNDKNDVVMHNNTPKNFNWIQLDWNKRFYKSVNIWVKMIFIELFVIAVTVTTFPFCGLFLAFFLSHNKIEHDDRNKTKEDADKKMKRCQCWGKKNQSDKRNAEKQKSHSSLRIFLLYTNRYANRPLSLWWNALIQNECKYIFIYLL